MKIKRATFVCSMIIWALSLIATGCGIKEENSNANVISPSPIQALQIENVESVQVIGGLPGVVGSALYLNSESEGKAVISKIINWIHEAKPIKEQMEYGKHGYPKTIEIIMNNGKRLNVEPGYHCVLQMNESGGGTKSCPQDKGEVIVSMGTEPHIRLASPELFNWLTEGWMLEQLH